MTKIRRRRHSRPGSRSLKIIRHFFPQVTDVKDADKDLLVKVEKRDVAASTKKDHAACALAVACKRGQHADGVIVSVKTAYIVKGRRARRFAVPEAVSREIVSFDRGAQFAPGVYLLKVPQEAAKLGARSQRRTLSEKSRRKTGKTIAEMGKRHITTGIRTVVGSRMLT